MNEKLQLSTNLDCQVERKTGNLEEMIWIDVVKKRRQTQILQPEDICSKMGFFSWNPQLWNIGNMHWVGGFL